MVCFFFLVVIRVVVSLSSSVSCLDDVLNVHRRVIGRWRGTGELASWVCVRACDRGVEPFSGSKVKGY